MAHSGHRRCCPGLLSPRGHLSRLVHSTHSVSSADINPFLPSALKLLSPGTELSAKLVAVPLAVRGSGSLRVEGPIFPAVVGEPHVS